VNPLQWKTMNSSNPETWSLPAGWAPLREGKWEFEQLRRFAVAVLAHDPTFEVQLDAFEDGYLKVDIYLRGTKIGEVFVNRDAGAQEGAAYRLFVGHDGHEQNVQSVEEAVACVVGATGVWRDYPGTVG
jgi:hypothetical protein